MFTLRQTDTGWEVVDAAGVVLASFTDGDASRTYALGVQWLADQALEVPPSSDAPTEDGPPPGALAERWQAGAQGIVFNGPAGDGRDFTDTVWTWRATVAPLPLMFLSKTEYGHFEAELAGWIDVQADPTQPGAVGGWFHDTEVGRTARDVLAAQGAFAVSVDPGAVEASFVCTEEEVDEWGSYCLDGVLTFQAYEIGGLTMVPFPGFGSAAIELVAAVAVEEPLPVEPMPVDAQVGDGIVASADRHPSVLAAIEATNGNRGTVAAGTEVETVKPDAVLPAQVAKRPPAHWLTMEEPIEAHEAGMAYVPQRDGQQGIPLQISADGHVYGHAALWGTCHVGIQGECVNPPASQAAYAHFHVGVVTADDGKDYATGALTAACDHAAVKMRASAARDHYAHNGVAWADVRASNGRHGVWLSGALRPDVTPEQVRVLRAGALSGDWRDLGVGLELIGVLAVNVPGFPIMREALAASGLEVMPDSHLEWAVAGGRQTALVASGIVSAAPGTVEALIASGTLERCSNCGQRGHRPLASSPDRDLAPILAEQRRQAQILAVIERRTRPSKETLAAAAAERRSRLALVRDGGSAHTEAETR